MTWIVLFIALALTLVLAHRIVTRRLDGRPRLRRPHAVRATPFVQKDIVIDGMRLRYIDEGTGPAVLLIPGHTSRIEECDRLAAALRPRFRVLTLDLPGTGYSDKPDRAYTLRFYEDVILAFLDALGVTACHVCGGSLGGNMALRLAHRAPARFARVVAWAPGSSWDAKPIVAAFMRRYGYVLYLVFSRIQSTFWYSKDWKGRHTALKNTFAYYDEVLCKGFVRMYWGIAADQIGWSLTAIARDIRQPTLLMWGDRDHGLKMGDGVRRLKRLMPRAELVVLAGAGHSLAAERPRELAGRVLEFLSRSDA